LQSISTDAAIIIVVKPLSANADYSIRFKFEALSNVIDVSDVQSENENFQSTSTDAGTQKQIMPLFANSDSSTRQIGESVSKITDVSDLHFKKYDWDIIEIHDEIHNRTKNGRIMQSRVDSFMIQSHTILR
jgi:hypothetical protein